MSDCVCEELIVEIFTRLPPKSLLRFRSLSKSLCSCISSPGFIRMHTFRSPQKILFAHSDGNLEVQPIYTLHGEDELPLILCPKRGYIGITTTTSFPRSPNFITIGKCNGTFCLQNGNNLTLWNPWIRRKISVPEFPRSSELNLGGIGFGFDPISDDYKIVWISPERDTCSFVYVVKTGAWCKIAFPKPQCSWLGHVALFFNRVLHWEVHYHALKSQEIYLSCIQTFDLSTHVYGEIPLPGPISQWMTTKVTTIQDSLALISHCISTEDNWIWVWRDASWSAVFNLGTGIITKALQLQPHNNKDLLVKTYAEGLLVYNPATGVRSRVVDFDAALRIINFRRCVETLHLLHMGETASETTQL